MSDLFVGASAGDDERDSRRREDASRRFEAFELGLGLASSRA